MRTTEFESTDRVAGAPALSVSPEKVFYIIAKAREFDVKDVVTDPDSSSNAADDAMLSVLEDHNDDPVFDELTGFINALDEDEQIDLVALTWYSALYRESPEGKLLPIGTALTAEQARVLQRLASRPRPGGGAEKPPPLDLF